MKKNINTKNLKLFCVIYKTEYKGASQEIEKTQNIHQINEEKNALFKKAKELKGLLNYSVQIIPTSESDGK